MNETLGSRLVNMCESRRKRPPISMYRPNVFWKCYYNYENGVRTVCNV